MGRGGTGGGTVSAEAYETLHFEVLDGEVFLKGEDVTRMLGDLAGARAAEGDSSGAGLLRGFASALDLLCIQAGAGLGDIYGPGEEP